MRKITLLVLFVISMITVKAQFTEGTGTEQDPYQIRNATELEYLRNYCNSSGYGIYFKLMNDIDLSNHIAQKYPINGWEPIPMLYGVLDGNCKVISGLWIDNKAIDEGVGLFRNVDTPGKITDLGVEVASGRAVKSEAYCTGILAGCIFGSTIERCYTIGNVESSKTSVGGFIGRSHGGSGVQALIKDSYHMGDVKGNAQVGGFCGRNEGVDIVNCYVSGNVIGNRLVASFIGSFSNLGTLVNCFYDQESNPSLPGLDGAYNPELQGKTREQLKKRTTFTNWDFNEVWGIDENVGYPFLLCSGRENGNENFCFEYGNGTHQNPYKIRNAEEWECLRNYLGSAGVGVYFKLMNDINLLSYIISNYPEEGWEPIGTASNPFKGNVNGNNHKITGIWINKPNMDNVGLFGYLEGSKIEKINVEGNTTKVIQGKNNVGLLAGNNNGDIINCGVKGNIKGYSNLGGLAGTNTGFIDNSYSIANVESTVEWGYEYVCVGGFIGLNEGEIQNSISNSNVKGGICVGGFVGLNEKRTAAISKSFSCGTVTGILAVGGFAGEHLYGKIDECFNISTTSGVFSVGGFVGSKGSVIENCHTHGNLIGDVDGSDDIAGFAGAVPGSGHILNSYSTTKIPSGYHFAFQGDYLCIPLEACFFDYESAEAYEGGTCEPTYGLSTHQMKYRQPFVAKGWDFTNVWENVEGCKSPYLQWQKNIEAGNNRPQWMSVMLTPGSAGAAMGLENNLNSWYNAVFNGNCDNVAGYPAPPAPKSTDGGDLLGIDQVKEQTLSISPNPTTGIVNIKGNNVDVKVYDMQGRQIIQTKNKTVDLSAYPSGVYIFNINGKIEKIIKQ